MNGRSRKLNRRPEERPGEQGATAVFVALLLLVIMGFVALGLDISVHTNTRQRLWDTLDAAALAGGSLLPDADAALQAALDYADANTAGLVPAVEFWCVVGVDEFGNPDESHIPGMCDPGPGPYNVVAYPRLECNARTCLIPCNPFSPEDDSCNAISVGAERAVDYSFARVIGFDQGSTGALVSASCKGPCGVDIDALGDIAMVLDRTGSMRAQDVSALKVAANIFLEGLSPSLHDVALGTIGRSNPSGPGPSQPSGNGNTGPWVPVGLSNDYDLTDNDPPDSPPSLNLSSNIVKAINCLSTSSTGTRDTSVR